MDRLLHRTDPGGDTAGAASAGAALAGGAGNAALGRLLGGDQVFRSAAGTAAGSTGGQVLRSAAGTAEGVPDGFASSLAGSGSGSSLPDDFRAQAENRLGAGFGDVRVHTDSSAAAAAGQVAANAFTVGSDIYFAAGQYDPGSRDGQQLLAHELTHVTQQGSAPAGDTGRLSHPGDPAEREATAVAERFHAGPVGAGTRRRVEPHIQRDPVLDDVAALAEADRARTRAVGDATAAVLAGASRDTTVDLATGFAAAAKGALADKADPDQVERGAAQASAVGGLTEAVTVPPDGEQTLGIADVLGLLSDTHEAASGGQAGVTVSAGLREVIRVIAARTADAVVAAMPGGASFAELYVNGVRQALDQAATASGDATALLRLELEGTISELVALREAAALAADESARAAAGAQVAETARRALLLDEQLRKATTRTAGSGPAPVDLAVEQRAGDIARIRQIAVTESATKAELGGGLDLLGQREVTIHSGETPDEPVFPVGEHDVTVVNPEEALPETTDTAEKAFAGQLTGQLRNQRTDVANLHDQVVPPSPAYTIDEFAAVHRRWFGFVSQAQELQDPTVKLIMDLMGEPYELMGRGYGNPAVHAEGGIARAYLMDFAVDMLSEHLSSGGTQFAKQVAKPTRSAETTGDADRPVYSSGELYPGAGSDEAARRRSFEQGKRDGSATGFSEVAAVKPVAQPVAAVAKGLAPDASVPLVGVHTVTAKEGWSYLVDVYSAGPADPQLVAREHKVVAPEVAEYLLAARQQQQALAAPHVPTADGKALGGANTRAGGIEKATATAAANGPGGQRDPKVPDQIVALRSELEASRDAVATGGPDRLIANLQADLRKYLDGYFAERQSMEYRLAAIFHIGNVEHNVGAQLEALLKPETIRDMMLEAAKIAGALTALQMLGPLGQLSAIAYQSYLSSQGVSDVAALIAIAGFGRNAAGADTLDKARAWGYMTPKIAADAGELFENLVTSPVTHGLQVLAHGAGSGSPRELADALRPLADDPVGGPQLRAALDAEITRREAQGPGDPELASLKAFRDSLMGRSAADTADAADAVLPGAQSASNPFATRRARSDADRAALQAALGDFAGNVAIVESDTVTGNGVHVRYGDKGGVRLEIGRDVEPQHIRRHVEVVRQLRRYEGPIGRIRALISRIQQIISGKPAYDTLGHEARLEVDKLKAIIAELETEQTAVTARGDRLTGAEQLDVAREAESIGLEIEALEAQLARHEENVDSYEKGRGFVAAEDTKSPTEVQLENLRDKQKQAYLEAEMLPRIYKRMADAGKVDLSLLTDAERQLLDEHVDGDLSTLTLAQLRRAKDAGVAELGREIRRNAEQDARLVEQLRQESIPLYDKMRAASPNSTAMRSVLGGARGLDFATGLPPRTASLDVDHIIPLRELVFMPGFKDLSFDSQLAIVNDVSNLRAIDSAANRSRSDWSWSEWPQAANHYGDAELAKMRALEETLRAEMAGKIAALKGR
ncbi:hypothetical protein Vau01_037890 [Virgisporangium aurantiacum]|uniref:eCIS core domain-containing protein n=2 Tax=Virgisporangium aurantiacum TaxID=175570 RepID=A0A8J3Z7F0_9ACTN|nr:hypothetical protein Vau01_037890 [Virgisporangium aurantiacum]